MDLIVFAGPNGAGKSFFADHFLIQIGHPIKSFDYDIEFNIRWNKFAFDPSVEQGIRDEVSELFEYNYNSAIKSKLDFSYQTNFHLEPQQSSIIKRFKEAGYTTTLVYLYVNSIETLKNRIAYRHEIKNLHNVPHDTVIERYNHSLNVTNKLNRRFDNVLILDNSKDFGENTLIPEPVYIRKGDLIEISPNCSEELLEGLEFVRKDKKSTI